ncbi:hypothetical protein BLNAU_4949 [Blattamonas nauphoetae]|uniref:Uncharacterized protein n=1 Tax=Blattamonas nauphoetae TaxID=2049346 RepID=A0ABQ9Y8N8_9EUKA|nr:hypothetical protein BLNAU_4949 [Blattamonas nauphoetae]
MREADTHINSIIHYQPFIQLDTVLIIHPLFSPFLFKHSAAGTIATGDLTSDSALTHTILNADSHFHPTPFAIHAETNRTDKTVASSTTHPKRILFYPTPFAIHTEAIDRNRLHKSFTIVTEITRNHFTISKLVIASSSTLSSFANTKSVTFPPSASFQTSNSTDRTRPSSRTLKPRQSSQPPFHSHP